MAYVTLEEANTYFESRLHAEAWTSATDTDKQKAIAMATRAIDRMPIRGLKTTWDQPNQFPRYPNTEVPQEVKDACCEEALAILERGNSQRRRLQQEGVASYSIGGLTETFVAGARGRGLISQEARELLRPWFLGAVRIT